MGFLKVGLLRRVRQASLTDHMQYLIGVKYRAQTRVLGFACGPRQSAYSRPSGLVLDCLSPTSFMILVGPALHVRAIAN